MGTETSGVRVWPVKDNPLLRRREHVVEREALKDLVRRLVRNLVEIEDPTGEFLLRLDDGRVIDTKGWAGWEWTHGVGLYGIWDYYRQTGEPRMREVVDDWFAARFAEDAPTKNVNTMAPFLTLAHLYEETRDRRLLPWLESWASWAMHDMPRTHAGGMQHVTLSEENAEQMWDDTLVMTVLPLAKIGRILGRSEYVAEAVYQALLHVQNLRDPATGLFFHGWSYEGRHAFASALWARGNSWITIALPDLIEMLDLPAADPTRRYLVQVLDEQIAALARSQDGSGLWHTLLDDPDSYLESSASAGFAYGIGKAVRLRLVDGAYAEVAERAVRGILDNISPEGELLRTSFGTAMGHDLDHYRRIPLTSMPYGQAMAILALSEYLRTYY